MATTCTVLLHPAAPTGWQQPGPGQIPPSTATCDGSAVPLPQESHRDSVLSCAVVSPDGKCAKLKRGGKARAGVKCQLGEGGEVVVVRGEEGGGSRKTEEGNVREKRGGGRRERSETR